MMDKVYEHREAIKARVCERTLSLFADRGMFSRGNLLELDQKGVRFIVGTRLRHLKSSERDRIFSQAPGFLKEGNLRRKAFWTGEFEKEGMRLIVSYDRKRADKDRAEREKILEKIRKRKSGSTSVRLWVTLQGARTNLSNAVAYGNFIENFDPLEYFWGG